MSSSLSGLNAIDCEAAEVMTGPPSRRRQAATHSRNPHAAQRPQAGGIRSVPYFCENAKFSSRPGRLKASWDCDSSLRTPPGVGLTMLMHDTPGALRSTRDQGCNAPSTVNPHCLLPGEKPDRTGATIVPHHVPQRATTSMHSREEATNGRETPLQHLQELERNT